MEKQFDDVWLQATGGYKSGIYVIVKKGFLARAYSACHPISAEIKTTDWQGHAILYQTLSNGCHVEYANGHARVYDGFNRQVFEGSL